MAYQQSAGRFTVTFNGSPLPEDVADRLTEATVEGDQNKPDMFVLSFRDPNRDVKQKTGVDFASKVTISAVSTLTSGPTQLFTGEVTAIEAKVDGSGTYTVVRGHDESHRLYRGTCTETYQNMTASDIAQKVCQRAGLQPGQFDSTSEVYEYFAQNNESDMAFLKRLASTNGYVVGVTDGKLNFQKPPQSSGAPGEGDLGDSSNPNQMVVGQDFLNSHVKNTVANQAAVEVRGFDMEHKQKLASKVAPTASNAQNGTSPAALAGAFGSMATAVGTVIPRRKQTDVDAAAKAAADHLGGGFAEVHGLARGNPSLKAGGTVSIGLAGDQFDGKYALTGVSHNYNAKDGYTTKVTVSGQNQRSPLGLGSGGSGGGGGGGGLGGGAGAGSAATGPAPVAGVVVATVTDINDPKKQGRIKVQFPWLSDDHVSDWIPMAQVGAGKQRGFVFLPKVDDLVICAFDHGDMNHPFVIGCLYNGVDTPKLGDDLIDGTTGSPKRRGVIGEQGQCMIFFEEKSDSGLALLSGDKGLRISLNQGTTTIKVSSSGEVQIEGKGNVSITSEKEVSVTAKEGVSITSDKDISVEAKQNLNLKGQSVSINGQTVSVTGNTSLNLVNENVTVTGIVTAARFVTK